MTPKIGYWTAECCLLDLHRIDTEQDLADVIERIANSDDCGELLLFKTLAGAIAYLAPANTPEERAEAFKRLGLEQT